VDRHAVLDLDGGYDFRSGLGRSTVQIGINNAFDAARPVVYNAPAANSDAATDDFLGRMVYLRLSQQFRAPSRGPGVLMCGLQRRLVEAAKCRHQGVSPTGERRDRQVSRNPSLVGNRLDLWPCAVLVRRRLPMQ
jgi:hypothetical protein